MRIMVARRREDVYRRPDLVIPREGAYHVAPVPIDDEGRLGSVIVTRHESELTREELLLLVEPGGVHTGVLLELEPTNGEIELHESYHVHVEARGWAEVEINSGTK